MSKAMHAVSSVVGGPGGPAGRFGRTAPFSFAPIASAEDFERHCRAVGDLRGLRWQHEQSMASLDPEVRIEGTCGLCMRETPFVSRTAGGEDTARGLVPNWREQMRCGCDRGLINRERALLHYMLATGALLPWMQVAAVGHLGNLGPAVAAQCLGIEQLEHAAGGEPARGRSGLPVFHLMIAAETLDESNTDVDALARFAGQLMEGARFVFSAAFNVDDKTVKETASVTRDPLGWHVLDRFRSAGFRSARMATFWSEEFGYLGPLNFVFDAVR